MLTSASARRLTKKLNTARTVTIEFELKMALKKIKIAALLGFNVVEFKSSHIYKEPLLALVEIGRKLKQRGFKVRIHSKKYILKIIW